MKKKHILAIVGVLVLLAGLWLGAMCMAWWRAYELGHNLSPRGVATEAELEVRLPLLVSAREITPIKTNYWDFAAGDRMVEYGVGMRAAFHVAYTKDGRVRAIIPISE